MSKQSKRKLHSNQPKNPSKIEDVKNSRFDKEISTKWKKRHSGGTVDQFGQFVRKQVKQDSIDIDYQSNPFIFLLKTILIYLRDIFRISDKLAFLRMCIFLSGLIYSYYLMKTFDESGIFMLCMVFVGGWLLIDTIFPLLRQDDVPQFLITVVLISLIIMVALCMHGSVTQ